MHHNETLKAEILQAVETQIRDNKPPETKQTYQRLLASGITQANAKIYIGQCLLMEMFNIMKHQQPFDEKRFVKNLERLPEKPEE
jgi:Domain of unknown function (DUF1841)